jgi:hypothetical protein
MESQFDEDMELAYELLIRNGVSVTAIAIDRDTHTQILKDMELPEEALMYLLGAPVTIYENSVH